MNQLYTFRVTPETHSIPEYIYNTIKTDMVLTSEFVALREIFLVCIYIYCVIYIVSSVLLVLSIILYIYIIYIYYLLKVIQEF